MVNKMKNEIGLRHLIVGYVVGIIIFIVSYCLIWMVDYTNISANSIIKHLLIIIWIEVVLILLVLLYWLTFVGENSVISIIRGWHKEKSK